jgi:hypothetical protein
MKMTPDSIYGRENMHLNPRLSGGLSAILIAASLLGLGACAAAGPPPAPPPTPTSTEGPIIMCTAPACWEDEVYSCPRKCPGGCGTVCSTRTPDPQASPTPTIPPFASICALPTAAAGTPGPRMAVCVGPDSVHVGDTALVAVEISGLERSDYINIAGDDEDGVGGYFTARVRSGGHTAIPIYVGARLRPDRIQSDGNRLLLTLKAVAAGPVKIDFKVVPTMPNIQASITITVLP